MPPKDDDFSEYRREIMSTLKRLDTDLTTLSDKFQAVVTDLATLKWKFLLLALISGSLAGQAPGWLTMLVAYVQETILYASIISFIGG